MTAEDLSALSALDPAPQRHLTPGERVQREDRLHRILAAGPATSPPPAVRRPLRWALWATAGAAAAVVTAATIVLAPVALRLLDGPGGSSLTAADISSWTATVRLASAGAGGDGALRNWCLRVGDEKNTATPTVLSAVHRGLVGSMVMKRGADYSFCMAGQDGGGFAELIDPPAALGPEGVRAVSGGGHGSDDAGFDYVLGRAGEDVARLSLAVGERTVEVALEDGWWTAWWPNPHDAPGAHQEQMITVVLRDGTSRTVPLSYE